MITTARFIEIVFLTSVNAEYSLRENMKMLKRLQKNLSRLGSVSCVLCKMSIKITY